MLSYVTPGAPPEIVATGADSVVYWAVDAAGQAYHLPGLNANSEIPFTLQVPRTMYGGMPIVMMVAGQPGTYYEIHTPGVAPPTVGSIPPSGWYSYSAMTGPGGTINTPCTRRGPQSRRLSKERSCQGRSRFH
jgi:hypothetical protein